MIVKPGRQAERFQGADDLGHLRSERTPARHVHELRWRTGHHDGRAPENLVELDGLLQVVAAEGVGAVVRGPARDAQVVEPLTSLLGLLGRPLEIGRVELDDLVAHLGHRAHRAEQVLGEFASHGVELDADRHGLPLGGVHDGQRRRRHPGRREKRPP
jgi:hypothetical protein